MRDDDDALEGIDLAAWQPTAPSPATADAVIARMREPARAAALDPGERPGRRLRWLGGLALVAIAIAAVMAWGLVRAPRASRGELVAARAQRLELGGSVADLDAGAELRWNRDRHRVTVHQARGTVRWTVADDDTLVIDSGGPGSAATIEASGASLRVEVQMNLSDMRLLGATTVTSAVVAVITAVVYAGQVKATSGGQTVNVIPGATVELRSPAPPRDPIERTPDKPPVDPTAVSGSPADVQQLKQQLEAADAKIAALTAQLAGRPSNAVSVPPAALDALRITGETTIMPDDDTKIAIARAGAQKVSGAFKLCVDASGTVSSITALKSTGFESYDAKIEHEIQRRKYRPFVRNGRPTPVCTLVTITHQIPRPAPAVDSTSAPPSAADHDTSRAPDPACEVMNVEDILGQASNQYLNGFASNALALVTKVLACKPDARTYRIAAMYACSAREVATARALFRRLPAQHQAAIEQRCQQEGINVRVSP